MRKILFFSGVLFCSYSLAQTTITKAFNDPVVGDVANNVIVTAGAIDNSGIGNPTTFNNPTATSGTPVTNTYQSLTSAEVVEFPAATIKHDDGNGTIIYYKQSADQLEIVGLANSIATIKLNNNPATAIKYPTAYGASNTDTTAGTTSYNGTNLNLSGNITSTAEGYGTLILGSNQIQNVLKLKIVLNLTIQVAGLPINVGTAQNTMFMYFAPTSKFPVLMSTAGSIVSSAANVNETFSGAQALATAFMSTEEVKKKGIKVYPNPTSDAIFIEGNKGDEVAIYSVDGKLLRKQSAKDAKVDMQDLPEGNYIITTTSEGGEKSTTKVIKK